MMKWLDKEKKKELLEMEIYKNTIIDIQEGWFNLIKELGLKISEYCKEKNIEMPKINQIKTKFGTLRFYHLSKNNDICEIIKEYEKIIDSTCELCGTFPSNVEVYNKLYINTCDKCKKN